SLRRDQMHERAGTRRGRELPQDHAADPEERHRQAQVQQDGPGHGPVERQGHRRRRDLAAGPAYHCRLRRGDAELPAQQERLGQGPLSVPAGLRIDIRSSRRGTSGRNSRARRRIRAVLPAVLLILAVPWGCGRTERPNVLVITVDTLRADRVGCYGFELAHTPAIDGLAREGVRCTNAATSAPITLPAHCSIMTGLYPPAHGVRDHGNYALGPEAVTPADRLP